MQHQVFLSYSRKDSAIMQRLRDDCAAAGLSVWTDAGIEPGTPLWKDSIERAIETAGCLIVILSPDSKQSEWVKRELDYAHAQRKPIFPVLARGDESSAVPFALSGTQFVDLQQHYAAGVQQLIAAVRERLNADAPPTSPLRHQSVIPNLPRRLIPRNPRDQFDLLWWLFFEPGTLAAYQATDMNESVRKTGAWIVTSMGWMPFVLPLLGYTLGSIIVDGEKPIALLVTYMLIVVGWFAGGLFSAGDQRAAIFVFVLTTFLGFSAFMLVRGISLLDFLPPDIRGDLGVLGIGINVGIVAGIAFTITDSATGLLGGLMIGAVLFASALRILPGTPAAVAGLLMAALGIITSKILTHGLETHRRTPGHMIIAGILMLNYAVLFWLYLLGGWQVLG
ncbi:MAG: toll/interleukin-1 receptor domain-containing protein [Anaerolineae bacterium]|nr:toll/interleukin-1 receptor domain-containing protein [Anaerolineae bacterium]